MLLPNDVCESPDRFLLAFAEHHHGLVRSCDVEMLGISRKAFRHRVSQQRLERMHAGVYRVCGSPRTYRQVLLAACWGAGPGAVASHRAACNLFDLDGGEDAPVEISVPRARSPHLDAVVVHRSLDLAADHVTEVDGIPVTTPTRLIADLGAVSRAWVVERVLEQSSARRLTTIADVRRMRELLSRQGRAGVGVLGAVLDSRGLGDLDSESVLESAMANLVRDYDLPAFCYQFSVEFEGAERRIDFAYPHPQIAVEVLGYEFHSRRENFQDDCLRGNQLVLLGWQVLEFTWQDVVHEPARVAHVIRKAIEHAERAAGFGATTRAS